MEVPKREKKKKTEAIKFRGTPEYREMLKRAATDRKITVQVMIEQSLALYLAGAGPVVKPGEVDIPDSEALPILDILVELATLTRRVEEMALAARRRGQKEKA